MHHFWHHKHHDKWCFFDIINMIWHHYLTSIVLSWHHLTPCTIFVTINTMTNDAFWHHWHHFLTPFDTIFWRQMCFFDTIFDTNGSFLTPFFLHQWCFLTPFFDFNGVFFLTRMVFFEINGAFWHKWCCVIKKIFGV